MKRWNRMTKWWLLWGAGFVALESYAVATRGEHPGGSLSSLVWRFTSHPVGWVVLAVGWGLLTVHFFFKKP